MIIVIQCTDRVGLVAVISLLGLLYWVQHQLPVNLVFTNDLPAFGGIFALVILIGILICLTSTYLAVSKYLKMKLDDLY